MNDPNEDDDDEGIIDPNWEEVTEDGFEDDYFDDSDSD